MACSSSDSVEFHRCSVSCHVILSGDITQRTYISAEIPTTVIRLELCGAHRRQSVLCEITFIVLLFSVAYIF